jgi:hypothetical protein
MPVISATQGSTMRRATAQAGPGTKQDPISKKKYKKAGTVTQVVEYLPSKCKALNLNHSTTKQKQNQKTLEGFWFMRCWFMT